MVQLSKKAIFLAQLVKEAGEIDSEKKLAKMLCLVEKERNVKTGFNFDKNHRHGNYTFEIKEETKNLQDAGLIEFRKETTQGYWGKPFTKHTFIATPKLKEMELNLDAKEKRAVKSIYREYFRYTPGEIERYDHAIFREGKTRTDAELRQMALKRTKELISKHKGDELAAFEEWLST